MNKLGIILRAERISRDLTLEQVSADIERKYDVDLRKTALGTYEKGSRIPRADVLAALMDYYNYSDLAHIQQILMKKKS